MPDLVAELVSILHQHSDNEMSMFGKDGYHWGWGSCQQRQRLYAVSRLCAAKFPGDIVEIGCRRGETTIELARIARENGRRVIAVDPWEVGRQNCDDDSEYQEFAKNTAQWADVIDVVRFPSQDTRVIRVLAELPLCFAFIDGLHTYDGCCSDIMAVSHCPVIAVDDTLWNPYVMMAFFEMADSRNRKKIQHPLCREAYLV